VVELGPEPRIHGYGAESDLARHYSFAEIVLIALTGAAPDRNTGRAFEVALAFLAPVPVSEAPAHAAGLARLIGADSAGVITGAAIGLAERARHILAAHSALIAWLHEPSGEFPTVARSSDANQEASVARLRDALAETGLSFAVLSQHPTLISALLGVLYALGLTEIAQLEAALTIAGMPTTIAEALAVKPFAFFGYPMDLPAFRYVEEPTNG
jgi:hypothetical protein